MDGVLCNFNGVKNALIKFKTDFNFFANLKPIARNYAVINWLKVKGYNVKILSASPHIQGDKAKIKWIKEYLPTLDIERDVILCRLGEDKSKYVKDITNSILIDDYSVNLKKWFDNGGLAIKYVGVDDNVYGKHTRYGIPYITEMKELLDWVK